MLVAGAVLAGCGGNSSSNGNPPVEHQRATRTSTVPSSAMEPTLHCATPGPGCQAAANDSVVVESYAGDDPERTDIVVFRTPPKAEQKCGAGGTFIKRLIGLPGETVTEHSGTVLIDGTPLKESYVKFPDSQSGTWHVPPGQYFFMGDNRALSCDSRQWGRYLARTSSARS